MAIYASFQVRHPDCPERIGSGKRRLGNPRTITSNAHFRDSNGWLLARLIGRPAFARQKSTNQDLTPLDRTANTAAF